MSFFKIMMAVFFAASPMVISFEELKDGRVDGQTVRMRGFGYPAQDGQWVLSPEADLKSCCVASAAKAGQQVLLSGFFEALPKGQVVEVEGVLSVNTEETPRYLLADAQLVKGEAFPWLTAAMTFFALAGGYVIFKKKSLKR